MVRNWALRPRSSGSQYSSTWRTTSVASPLGHARGIGRLREPRVRNASRPSRRTGSRSRHGHCARRRQLSKHPRRQSASTLSPRSPAVANARTRAKGAHPAGTPARARHRRARSSGGGVRRSTSISTNGDRPSSGEAPSPSLIPELHSWWCSAGALVVEEHPSRQMTLEGERAQDECAAQPRDSATRRSSCASASASPAIRSIPASEGSSMCSRLRRLALDDAARAHASDRATRPPQMRPRGARSADCRMGRT